MPSRLRLVLRAWLAVAALLPVAAHANGNLALHVTRVEERSGAVPGGSDLWLILDRASRVAFGAWTRRHVGQGVQLRVDGDLLVEARLQEAITSGTIVLQSGIGQRRGAIQTVLSHAKGLVTAVAVP